MRVQIQPGARPQTRQDRPGAQHLPGRQGAKQDPIPGSLIRAALGAAPSDHGNASAAGWTTVFAAKNLGSGTGNDWGPEVKFRADNDKTVFSDMETAGQSLRLSRNAFFKRVGHYPFGTSHHPIDIRWEWRGSAGHRYRCVKSIRGIIAGG